MTVGKRVWALPATASVVELAVRIIALALIGLAVYFALGAAPAVRAQQRAPRAQQPQPAGQAPQPAGAAQHQHGAEPHDHGAPQLGNVTFPISCAPAAQATFTRGVALLHSFWYAEAEKTFAQVTKADPSCAMGYWGIAMTQYHPLWAAPTPDEFTKGQAAAKQAVAKTTKTPRERDYVKAIAAYFDNPAAADHRARAVAYEKAMQALHDSQPADDEATIFYALALISTAPPTDKTYAQQKQAGALLNEVLPKNPQHPGVAHYLIHSFDSPPLAPLALDAARAYAKIAPSAPHAQHMPSHIFVRLGYWDDAISSNLASAASAHAQVTKPAPSVASFDELHALDYAVYGYLQRAQDDKAREIVERVVTLQRLENPNFAAGYAIAAIPGRYAVERRAWAEAATVPVRPEGFPWDAIPYAETSAWYARGLGAAHAGNLAVANDAINKLSDLQTTLAAANDRYWPDQIEIQKNAIDAWIARAEKRDNDAVRFMKASADLEATTEKHPVTPGALLPSREQLGDLLLELGRADEALEAYEASLAAAPKRWNSLYGAARAAQQSGKRDKAKQYFADLVSITDANSPGRPALTEARAFLASQ